MEEKDRAFVQASLGGMPSAVYCRAALAWVLAFLGVSALRMGGRLLGRRAAAERGAPLSALVQALGADVLLKRVLPFFYFEEDYAKNFRQWLPSLGARFRQGFIMPLAVAFAPLAVAFLVAQPLGVAALIWIAAWGVVLALGAAWALQSLVVEPTEHLRDALRRFGQGRPASACWMSPAAMSSATPPRPTTRPCALRGPPLLRAGALRPLGAAGEERGPLRGRRAPGRGAAAGGGAGVRLAQHRRRDQGPAKRPQRLGAMNRFYEVVQDAVDKAHGAVLDLGEGRVLACWGAPLVG